MASNKLASPHPEARMRVKLLLKEIDEFLENTGIAPTRFGVEAVGDRKFVYGLRQGWHGVGEVRAAKARAYMAGFGMASTGGRPHDQEVAPAEKAEPWAASALREIASVDEQLAALREKRRDLTKSLVDAGVPEEVIEVMLERPS